ncbi:MAG: hypothetical protein O3A01_04420 [bacterium]|nr:hypothetical protein [bacterium]
MEQIANRSLWANMCNCLPGRENNRVQPAQAQDNPAQAHRNQAWVEEQPQMAAPIRQAEAPAQHAANPRARQPQFPPQPNETQLEDLFVICGTMSAVGTIADW